jgi:hypothetical protein
MRRPPTNDDAGSRSASAIHDATIDDARAQPASAYHSPARATGNPVRRAPSAASTASTYDGGQPCASDVKRASST